MVNKVILVGNLGRDPEVRTTPNGQTIAKFSLATNRKWNDRQGQRQEQTEWHNIVCWGRQAEIAGQYLRTGKQVYIEGRIQTRSWDDQESGQKKYMTEIIVDNFQMLGGRDSGGGGGNYGGGGGGGNYGGGGGGGGGYGSPSGGGGGGYGSPSGSGGGGGGGYGSPSGGGGPSDDGGDYGGGGEDDDIPF